MFFLHEMLEIVSCHIWWLKFEVSFLKNFSKCSDKHQEQSSGGVQSKDVLKNFVQFTEKHLCRILLLTKLQARNLKLAEAVAGDGVCKTVCS